LRSLALAECLEADGRFVGFVDPDHYGSAFAVGACDRLSNSISTTATHPRILSTPVTTL
jgi:hypothetical protein